MPNNTYTINDLKALIESLSSAEKRHFSLISTAFSSSEKIPFYLQLFQFLEKDNTELSGFVNELALPETTTVKNRLFQNILRSLRLFHQNGSIDIQIQNLLSDIEILYNLSVPEQAYFVLKKALKMAEQNEKFFLLLKILDWEKRLIMIIDKPVRSILEITQAEQFVLEKITQLISLKHAFGRMMDMKKKYGQTGVDSNETINQEIVKLSQTITKKNCLSQRALFYYNYTFAIYYWITNNYPKAYHCSKSFLNPELKQILPSHYIDGILEHATACIQLGKFPEASEVLSLTEHIAAQQPIEPALKTKIFYYVNGYQLVLFNYTGQKEKLTASILNIETQLGAHEQNMPREARLVLKANLMNAYLGIGNQEKTDRLWNDLFKNTSKSVRRSIYDDLRFFKLFCLLQEKNYDILPSAALSAYRYYNHNGNAPNYFYLELKISALLMKAYHLDDIGYRKKLFEEIKRHILNYIEGFKNAKNFQEHYSLYEIWIEAIIKNQPFCEAAANWYRIYALS